MYLNGYGYSAIFAELDKLGMKTKFGKPFGKNSLYSILSNPRYSGTYTFNKVSTRADGSRNSHSTSKDIIVIEDALPAIISKEAYKKVMEKMQANKRRAASYKAKNVYLLSGLLVCRECGASMIGKTTSARGVKYHYYKCGSQEKRTGDTKCQLKAINMTALDEVVFEQIEKNIFAKDRIKDISNGIIAEYEKRNSSIEQIKVELQKQKSITERKMDNLYTKIEDGIADDYDMERLKKVKEEMTSIKTQLGELEYREEMSLTSKEVTQVMQKYHKAIQQQKDPGTSRALLNNFVNKLTISSEKLTIEFKVNFCDMIGAGEGT